MIISEPTITLLLSSSLPPLSDFFFPFLSSVYAAKALWTLSASAVAATAAAVTC